LPSGFFVTVPKFQSFFHGKADGFVSSSNAVSHDEERDTKGWMKTTLMLVGDIQNLKYELYLPSSATGPLCDLAT